MAKPLWMETRSLNLQPGGTMKQGFLVRGNLCLLLLGFPGPDLVQNDSVSVEGGWSRERDHTEVPRREVGEEPGVNSGVRGSFHISCYHIEFFPVGLSSFDGNPQSGPEHPLCQGFVLW